MGCQFLLTCCQFLVDLINFITQSLNILVCSVFAEVCLSEKTFSKAPEFNHVFQRKLKKAFWGFFFVREVYSLLHVLHISGCDFLN